MCCTKRNREMKLSQPPEVGLTNVSARIYNPDTKKKNLISVFGGLFVLFSLKGHAVIHNQTFICI